MRRSIASVAARSRRSAFAKPSSQARSAPSMAAAPATAAAAAEAAPAAATVELYAVLLAALRPGETLPQAIRRLKPGKAPARDRRRRVGLGGGRPSPPPSPDEHAVRLWRRGERV